MRNGSGNFEENRERTMRCYDLLPPALREAHRNAISYWATGPFLGYLKRGMSLDDAVEQMIVLDLRHVRKDAKKEWGKQAAAYLAAHKPRTRRDYRDRPARTKL